MTIYQQELLRKLPHFGCTGQYSETDEALAFFYDGFKIGWQDKAGYIYGAIDKELTDEMRDAFYAVQDQAKTIREYTDLYETSPRMGIRDVDEYRRFAEYGDTVLAGMYSEKHGFMFTTWKQSADRRSVSHGDYSPDFEYAKESFTTRSGLIDAQRLFTEDEASNFYRCLDFAKGNCETLTYEQEKQLDELMTKLRYGYPQLEEAPPSFEQDDAPQINM